MGLILPNVFIWTSCFLCSPASLCFLHQTSSLHPHKPRPLPLQEPPTLSAPQPPSGGGETLSPELFTGIVQGVLSTMMGSLGAGQGNTESIAQFIQRLSQTSNLFTPGTGDAVGQFLCFIGSTQSCIWCTCTDSLSVFVWQGSLEICCLWCVRVSQW